MVEKLCGFQKEVLRAIAACLTNDLTLLTKGFKLKCDATLRIIFYPLRRQPHQIIKRAINFATPTQLLLTLLRQPDFSYALFIIYRLIDI